MAAVPRWALGAVDTGTEWALRHAPLPGMPATRPTRTEGACPVTRDALVRKIAALRRLIARPGTPAEGKAAELALARLQRRHGAATEKPQHSYSSILYRPVEASWEDILHTLQNRRCPCGHTWPRANGHRCPNIAEHERIRAEVKRRFPRGMRVYYNAWAYDPNSPATVAGYPSGRSRFAHADWGWIRLRFDHLKNVQSVPCYKDGGWSVTDKPAPQEKP